MLQLRRTFGDAFAILAAAVLMVMSVSVGIEVTRSFQGDAKVSAAAFLFVLACASSIFSRIERRRRGD